jgi:5-methylcytosine-specific restriction endonuclease McrBC regulatory subunit McrC
MHAVVCFFTNFPKQADKMQFDNFIARFPENQMKHISIMMMTSSTRLIQPQTAMINLMITMLKITPFGSLFR